MPADMSNAEQEIPQIVSHAEKWVRDRALRPKSEPLSPNEKLTVKAQEAYNLFTERQDLRSTIVRAIQGKSGGESSQTLEEKQELIRRGRVGNLLASLETPHLQEEVVKKSQARITEIEQELDKLLSTPGVYARYQEGYHHEISVRERAGEVGKLEQLTDLVDINAVKLTRNAQVRGRTLTSVEQGVISDSRALREEAKKRKAELLKDPDVFDRVRILEIRELRDQLLQDRFAETPSRKRYLEKIERYWAEGKKVLLTGETGTGKTEIIKHASNKLFGVNPESVTGHQDLSIYELLGKTGFQVQVGDVFRPAPLIRAMTGRDGKGQPFLFDEIDRAPNQSVMGIKTILNARPGEKGVKVQTDTAGSFNVGPDYAVSATANIKSEKHITATELDPAIVRVFDAPMDIDYMPAYEVYDLALASLMDKRGGVPLTENDARVLLKNLCDASSWIQDAYQGRKIITDPASGTFLEARGQAATRKAATLKKALLDPGRTLDMLRGWTAAQTRGITFEDYMNERILEFINNRAYPEEDRYYLTEIFALKGFLKGHKISEVMVSGLDQGTLDRWAGSVNKKQAAGKATPAYSPWNRVARLDPYRRFKRPVSADAEELLKEEEVIQEEEGQATAEIDGPMIERARKLLGKDFLGMEAIKAMENKFKGIGVNVEFIIARLPAFPYTEEDLRIAKENGEMVVLRPETMLMEGRQVDLTVVELRNLFKKDPQDKMAHPVYPYDWFDNEGWANKPGEMEVSWAIVKKDVLDSSISKTWNDQKEVLRQYEAGLKRKGAKNASVKRRTALEAVWDSMLYYTNTGERVLPDKWDWTQTQTSNGYLVYVGGFDQIGLNVDRDDPWVSDPSLGVCPSR